MGRPQDPEITRYAELLGIDRKMAGSWGVRRMKHKLAIRTWREKRAQGRLALVGAVKHRIPPMPLRMPVMVANPRIERMVELASKRRMA